MEDFMDQLTDQFAEDLEQFRSFALFSLEEIEDIATKRRDNLARITKVIKTKDDYVIFTNYEKEVLNKVISKGVDRGLQEAKTRLDERMIDRLQKIYWELINSFLSDYRSWIEYFEFFISLKRFSVNDSVNIFLQLFGDREDSWKMAAEWAATAGNHDGALYIIHRGMETHPENLMLHMESIKSDFDYIDVLLASRDDSSGSKVSLRYQSIQDAFSSAEKNISDVTFFQRLLERLQRYPQLSRLQKKVESHIFEKFKAPAVEYDERARLIFNRGSQQQIDVDTNSQVVVEKFKDRFAKAIATYKDAVKDLNSREMWDLYLKFVAEMNIESTVTAARKNALREAMEEARKLDMMSSQNYIQYAQFEEKYQNFERAANILLEGTNRNPYDMKIWFERVRLQFTQERRDEGVTIFLQALNIMDLGFVEDCYRLWDMVIITISYDKPQTLERLFLRGLRSHESVARFVQPRFLQWRALTQGLGAARALAANQEVRKYPSEQFWQLMCILESAPADASMRHIRTAHEKLCEHFGVEDIKPWTERINFEMEKGDRSLIPKVIADARERLNPELLATFEASFGESFLERHNLKLPV